MRIISAGIAGIIASLVLSNAWAGTYMESVQSLPAKEGQSPPVLKSWFDKGRYRIEMTNQKVQIFKDKTFYTVDTSKKTYSKMSEADIKAIFEQANASTKALRDLLPPKQREEMEKQDAERAKGPSEYARTLKASSRTEQSALGACKVWEAYVKGDKVQEICVVPLTSVPNTNDFLAAVKEADSMMKGTPAAGSGGSPGWADMETTKGFPVITRIIIAGKPRFETKVMAVRAAPTPESLFAVPKDYREVKEDLGRPSL